jgi:hypothetical protein
MSRTRAIRFINGSAMRWLKQHALILDMSQFLGRMSASIGVT